MNDIGEDSVMIHYVRQYLKKTYPSEYNEFLEKIMWKDGYIGIEYVPKKTRKSSKSSVTSSKSSTITLPKTSGSTYDYKTRLDIAEYYLNNDIGLKELEKVKMSTKADGTTYKSFSGSRAKTLLNQLGINTSDNDGHKGLLKSTNINNAIATATDMNFKKTLEEIKKRKSL
jgi:hypothetical protein